MKHFLFKTVLFVIDTLQFGKDMEDADKLPPHIACYALRL